MYLLRYEKDMSGAEISKELKNRFQISVSKPKISLLLGLTKSDAKRKYTDYQKNVLLALYKKAYSVDKVITYARKSLGIVISKKALVTLAHRAGVSRDRIDRTSIKILTRMQEKEVVDKYKNGKSSVILSSEYGFKTSNSILQVLEKNNIPRRTLKENTENFKKYSDFDLTVIDSNFKAYYIGLMLADGYVHKNEKTWAHYLDLSMIDEDVMQFVGQHTGAGFKKVNIQRGNREAIYRTQVFGKEIVDQVQRYGLVPRKSLTLSGPVLLEKEKVFLPYLIRGVIDGDGWIRKDGKEFFICTASKEFAEWLLSTLKELGFIEMKIRALKNSPDGLGNLIHVIRTAKSENIERLKELIYDKPYGMKRKYDRLHGLFS